MMFIYEHCGVRWQCSEKHFDGDVCFACGERAAGVPDTIDKIDVEPEHEKGD